MDLPSSASTIALYPRRAVLRIGILLRDSPAARRGRDLVSRERHRNPVILTRPSKV
jgi:hypothetical protein